MAQPLGRFAFKKLAKYPHMKPADVEIWEQFIRDNRHFFDRVDYDFPVGSGADFLPTGEDTPEGRENKLYQRKIDVVGYRDGQVWLVEVKPMADTEALGQILTYQKLYLKSKNASQSPTMMVLAGKITNEMKEIYAGKDVAVIIV